MSAGTRQARPAQRAQQEPMEGGGRAACAAARRRPAAAAAAAAALAAAPSRRRPPSPPTCQLSSWARAAAPVQVCRRQRGYALPSPDHQGGSGGGLVRCVGPREQRSSKLLRWTCSSRVCAVGAQPHPANATCLCTCWEFCEAEPRRADTGGELKALASFCCAGSMLIDADSRLGLGPLTGGADDRTCSGATNLYGSLYVASVP